MITVVVVGILIIVILVLVVYNIKINSRIQEFRNINQKITNLQVVQDFMNTIGETSSVDQKIKKINDILVEKYEIKYSTIVVFNGAEYEIKASNVDKKHWEALKSLQDVDMFKDSQFLTALKNTLEFTLYMFVILIVLSLAIALLLFKKKLY